MSRSSDVNSASSPERARFRSHTISIIPNHQFTAQQQQQQQHSITSSMRRSSMAARCSQYAAAVSDQEPQYSHNHFPTFADESPDYSPDTSTTPLVPLQEQFYQSRVYHDQDFVVTSSHSSLYDDSATRPNPRPYSNFDTYMHDRQLSNSTSPTQPQDRLRKRSTTLEYDYRYDENSHPTLYAPIPVAAAVARSVNCRNTPIYNQPRVRSSNYTPSTDYFLSSLPTSRTPSTAPSYHTEGPIVSGGQPASFAFYPMPPSATPPAVHRALTSLIKSDADNSPTSRHRDANPVVSDGPPKRSASPGSPQHTISPNAIDQEQIIAPSLSRKRRRLSSPVVQVLDTSYDHSSSSEALSYDQNFAPIQGRSSPDSDVQSLSDDSTDGYEQEPSLASASAHEIPNTVATDGSTLVQTVSGSNPPAAVVTVPEQNTNVATYHPITPGIDPVWTYDVESPLEWLSEADERVLTYVANRPTSEAIAENGMCALPSAQPMDLGDVRGHHNVPVFDLREITPYKCIMLGKVNDGTPLPRPVSLLDCFRGNALLDNPNELVFDKWVPPGYFYFYMVHRETQKPKLLCVETEKKGRKMTKLHLMHLIARRYGQVKSEIYLRGLPQVMDPGYTHAGKDQRIDPRRIKITHIQIDMKTGIGFPNIVVGYSAKN